MSFAVIKLTIPTIAVAKSRPRFKKSGYTYTPQKTKSFEAELRWHWQKSNLSMFPLVPLFLGVTIFLPRPKKPKLPLPVTRPDLDNYAKAIMDGLNGFAWKDDAQIVRLNIAKYYTTDAPKIQIEIQQMETPKGEEK